MVSQDGDQLGARELLAQFDIAMRAGVVRHMVEHLPAGVAPIDVRQSFAEQLGARRAACWQDAWDAWVTHHRGAVPVTSSRCERCRGRRFDQRTGRICAVCCGRGVHRHTVRARVRLAPRP